MYLNFCLCDFDWSIFSNVVTAIATVGLLILAIISACYIFKQIKTAQVQINQTKKIAEADFILKMNSNFFTKETKDLFFLIENNLLKNIYINDKINNIDLNYFEIDKERIKLLPAFKEYYEEKKKKYYSSNDIEHLLLNNFEDIGIMKNSNLINDEHIFENYSYYIVCTCSNKEINKYIKKLQEYDSEFYSNMINLYKKYKSNDDLEL